MSNWIHLWNFASDRNEWAVNMTIRNVCSKIRQVPAQHNIVMVPLLPISIKNRNIPQLQLDARWQTNWEVPNEVLQWVIQPLTFGQNPSAKSRYYNVLCADGNFWHCKPVLVAWLADCPGYSNLHHLEWHVCFWYECPPNELGDYLSPEKQHPCRNHNLYRMLWDANSQAANVKLFSCHIYRGFCFVRHIPCFVNDLPKPDLLYSMEIGMLDLLPKWMFHFMKTQKLLNKYNAIWLSVPAYCNLTPKNKSYKEISQTNEKEMKGMSRYLLPVVTQTQWGRSPA